MSGVNNANGGCAASGQRTVDIAAGSMSDGASSTERSAYSGSNSTSRASSGTACAIAASNSIADDRLAHAWELALSGLRRGEIAGLRWADIDLEAKTLVVANNRVAAGSKTVEGDPKSETSRGRCRCPTGWCRC